MNAYAEMIEKVKRLWIETFHDSREYVDMVIDHYYDDRLCRRRYIDDRLISSAIMIPYSLKLKGNCIDVPENVSAENGEISTCDNPHVVKCGYLCGLATVEEWRGKGIMASLISESENVAMKNGFSAVALIPADERLRRYYSRLGYRDTARLSFIDVKYNCKQSTHRSVSDINARHSSNLSCNDDEVLAHISRKDCDAFNLVDIIRNISGNISGDISEEMSGNILQGNYKDIEKCIFKLSDDIFCLDNIVKADDISAEYLVNTLIYKCRRFEENKNQNILIHDSLKWRDVLCDIFRDGGYVCFSVDSNRNITDNIYKGLQMKNTEYFSELAINAAVCITPSSKIIPLFGDYASIGRLVSGLLVALDSGSVDGCEMNFSIQCRDALEADYLMGNFTSDEKFDCFQFSRREEKYGMIKFLEGKNFSCEKPSTVASSIGMRLMLD